MARRRYQFGRVLLQGKKCQKRIGRWREDVIEPDASTRRVELSAVLGTRDQIPTARLARRCLDLILANVNSPDHRPDRVAIAIIEFTYNFVRFCAELLNHMIPLPESVNFKIELRNAFLDDAKLYLTPYSVASHAFMFGTERHEAEEESMQKHLEIATRDLAESPAAISYLLVRLIYSWFGITAEKIPYVTRRADGMSFVDEELIKTARAF
jgi:hypothetical protein